MTTAVADRRKTGQKARIGLTIERIYTTAGVDAYDTVRWEKRDIVQRNWKTGDVIFEQFGVEFPEAWSANASTIVATKYFRGALGSPDREHSLRQLVDRVVDAYVTAGVVEGYFATANDAEIFGQELKWMLIHQVFSFNSPVWFNVGTSSKQQVSACFILSVDDTMDSILNWYTEEGRIFKRGSGAGLNLSKIRASNELLKSGGTASGPVSFMRGADASAGTIKSGGATRRAAKMVILDVDHPDIVEFIETKAKEERKIRALRDAGFDMDLGGADIVSVQYQNANNSVRVTDEFMEAVEADGTFDLKARTTGKAVETVRARELFHKIATAAWECADPGIQYHDTINSWHTLAADGPITGSNPCSEYMSLDNTSCNLASLNLMAFLSDDGQFDTAKFVAAVKLIITAMDISICFADFPTKAIGDNTRKYRQLGIGFANLGALLMATGRAYDSQDGRDIAAAITAAMTGAAYHRSAELAIVVGPYPGYSKNAEHHSNVMQRHEQAAASASRKASRDAEPARILRAAVAEWHAGNILGRKTGWRNAQASVLAPTGTISLAMDCDTTGIEPDLALVKFKKLVGGGSLRIVNQQVERALRHLDYSPDTIAQIVHHIDETGSAAGAPGLLPQHTAVFDCAMGDSPISADGHLLMMAACQPFLSGAISKTVNLPETATVEDVERIYQLGWKLGLKAVAVYRDNCKVGQPLNESKTADDAAPAATRPDKPAPAGPVRRRLPATRSARTTSFKVGEVEGYLTSGEYPDGELGEIFLKLGKQGSTMAGITDALAMAVSVGLQYGVPLEVYTSKYVGQSFEPKGITPDPDIRIAQSILDYVFRRLALDYMGVENRQAMGIYTLAERTGMLDTESRTNDVPTANSVDTAPVATSEFRPTAPMCFTCGTNANMRPSGACWVCESCGSSSGCS